MPIDEYKKPVLKPYLLYPVKSVTSCKRHGWINIRKMAVCQGFRWRGEERGEGADSERRNPYETSSHISS